MQTVATSTGRVTSREQIADRLAVHGSEIRALGVRSLRVFGSFARGEQRSDSDVDLLVDFERGEKTYDRFIALATLLEDLLDRRVELVTRESLSPYLGPRILAEARDVPFAA